MAEERVRVVDVAAISSATSVAALDGIAEALEAGQVLLLPGLSLPIAPEVMLIVAAIAMVAKNVSFDTATGRLKGLKADHPAQSCLRDLMSAFARFSASIMAGILPAYAHALRQGRTSFRPVEIEGRRTSWRKDDTRLHVDSFPATPVHGHRILRFFTNVNPDGKPRLWRVGESFTEVAGRFLPRLRAPVYGADVVLNLLGATKTRRTAYDHYMLQLHDAMKRDMDYQARARQSDLSFPAGSSWVVYTDVVSHAAMSGQYAFEQTFYLPPERMRDPSKSPLHVLQSALQRKLV